MPTPSAQITSANQLALQSKTQLEATGAFVVEPDGRVRMASDRGGGYAPPWVWAPALTDDQKTRIALATPSSDPSSPWRSAVPYKEGGPFTHHSEWDSTNGTYDGGIDWGTLLGTIGVGALFATPALAAAFAGGGGSTIPAAFGSTAVDTVSSAAPAAAAVSAPAAAIPAEFGSTAVDTVTSAAPAGSTLSKLPDWLKEAKDLGDGFGAAAAGRAQGRNLDNIANIGFAQAQNDLYNSELKAPQQIASNSVRGDILSNAKDVSIAAPSDIPVPQISGGLRPSMFSDSTRQVGKNITANAAATPMPVATPPTLQPMETAGATDDILNTAGYLSNLAKPGYDIWKMFNHA